MSVSVDGAKLPAGGYSVDDKTLTLTAPPAGAFVLEIVTGIKPQENTKLEGLYKSSGNYCTQCEAQVGALPGWRAGWGPAAHELLMIGIPSIPPSLLPPRVS